MANIDSTTTPFVWPGSGTLTLEDGGGNTCQFYLEGEFSWTETGREWAEATQRGRHQSAPVAVETTDGSIEISISGKVTSFKGSANVHPYEALLFRGNAIAWTTVGSGSKKMLKLTAIATHDTGSSQTIVFAYCIPTNVECNLNGEDGQATISASLTNLQNTPTIT